MAEGDDSQRPIADSAKQLTEAITQASRPVIFFFDETDYITPSSPTAAHWHSDFNVFWRNLRAVYQEICRGDSVLSLLICGVSSKWFSVESIDEVENAALSMIPEEYLSPLPRGATIAMVRKVGRIAGLQFDDRSADLVAEHCADMPFWVRKAGSYIHRSVDVGERPVQLTRDRVSDLLNNFVRTDGVTIAHVALRHLFRVYPELEGAVRNVVDKNTQPSRSLLLVLQRYGIVDSSDTSSLAGDMIRLGCELHLDEREQQKSKSEEKSVEQEVSPLDEWAEELALIGKRRNVLEKRLRSIVVNFLRADFLGSSSSKAVAERITAVVPSSRRNKISHLSAEEAVEQLMWRELVELIAAKEWTLFLKLFGDKGQFRRDCGIINDRPDAHAKNVDPADLALYRRSLKSLESAIAKVL